ncbi:hypothetical protein GQX74_006254 [Glossina fuscipes]|nr:hypothetical protein GQX74_006254 [Glossina fuscipes]
METESFYGVELSDKDPLAQFEVDETDKEVTVQQLIIKQISLGAEAKSGEFNVVQAEVKINEKETLKIPVAVLKAGETRVLRPNLEFPSDSVTFKLTQGSGPKNLIGISSTLLQKPCMQGVPSGKTSGGSTGKQVSLILMRQHL